MFFVFAGPIITEQDVRLFQSIIATIGAMLLGLLIFLFSRYILKSKFKFYQSIIVGFIIVGLVWSFSNDMVRLKQDNWLKKQEYCAKQAGYEYAWQDNSSDFATYAKQQLFRQCLQE